MNNMPGKTMGSESVFVTVPEAASILGVTSSRVHVFGQSGYLEEHYPEGRRPEKKRFLREDVLNLKELREQVKGSRALKIPQVAMKAYLSAKRTERRLEELLRYLGINTRTLPEDPDQIRAFYLYFEHFSKAAPNLSPEEILDKARDLQGITEEYLELTVSITGRKDAWEVFAKSAKILASKCSVGTVQRMFVDHARANLRNITYFYVRGSQGVRAAERMFPKEGYVTELVHTMYPFKD